MASAQTSSPAPASLERGQLGLFGVIMPGLAQVAPAFNLFFTTGLMVALAGASAPLIFLISMVGMIATASSLAQFSGVYPSASSFITYITRAIGTKVATAVGIITILGYIIAFGGIYIFVGSYIVQNVFDNVHVWGLTGIVTIVYGALVVAPVVVGLKFGVRITVALYVFEVALLLVLSVTILVKGGEQRPVGDAVQVAERLGQGRAGGVQPGRARLRRVRGRRATGRGDPQPAAHRPARRARRRCGQRDHLRAWLLCPGHRLRRGPCGHAGRRRQPVPHRGQGVPAVRRPAHHLDLPVQRDQLLRGRQHADLAGDLRRRPGRPVAPRAGPVLPRFKTPAVAAIAFVAPSI